MLPKRCQRLPVRLRQSRIRIQTIHLLLPDLVKRLSLLPQKPLRHLNHPLRQYPRCSFPHRFQRLWQRSIGIENLSLQRKYHLLQLFQQRKPTLIVSCHPDAIAGSSCHHHRCACYFQKKTNCHKCSFPKDTASSPGHHKSPLHFPASPARLAAHTSQTSAPAPVCAEPASAGYHQ